MSDSRFVRCSQCGALNEPRAVFCSRCGASLPGAIHGTPRPKVNNTSVALGTALLLFLAILAFVLYTTVAKSLDKSVNVVSYAGQTGIPASTEPPASTVATDASGAPVDADTSVSTTTTEPLLVVRPKATVSSSALKGTSTASFQATNLLDGQLSTAWIEGAKGPGLGEWVRFEFSKPILLARIEIANGYQKDSARFARDPRVRLVSVEYSSGATQLVELLDTEQVQFIIPADEAVEWIKLVVVSVYEGEDGQDTALSEVQIFERTE